VGLGSMERDCSECHGVGHVKVMPDSVVDAPLIAETVIKVKRKRRTPAEMLADATKNEI